jgi:hypothetical protein
MRNLKGPRPGKKGVACDPGNLENIDDPSNLENIENIEN